jgi:hypothetical protein
MNGPQDALKPDTMLPSGITVFCRDTSRSEGFWWCKCWCRREFVAHESTLRDPLTKHCGGPKHYRKPAESLHSLRKL